MIGDDPAWAQWLIGALAVLGMVCSCLACAA